MKKISASKESVDSIEKFAPKASSAVEIKSEKKVASKTPTRKAGIARIFFATVVALLVLGSGASAFYFYHKYKTVPSVETDDVAAKIGKLMELPQGEVPTLATVTDKEKMKAQPFFAKSENGDKVLIYTQAQKAILYRPSINKIIEVMQLSISKPVDAKAQQTSADATPSQSQEAVAPESEPAQQTPASIKVAVYNGSTIKGKAGTVGDEIAKIDGVIVSEKTNATGSFDSTLVVDLSGNNAEKAQAIASAVGGKVGEMPAGETKPSADVLVIAGKN